MNCNTVNNSPQLIDKINTFNIKIETCPHELYELATFLRRHPVLCPGKQISNSDLLQAKMIHEIELKIQKKLSGLNGVKSIRFNYYELAIIKAFYHDNAIIEIRVEFPQMVRLVTKVDQAIPEFH
ncbi:MAG: hypothetical protein ACI8ZM_002482 [Crocinitomix sp.]|jgi:hypothetical protein